MPAKLKSNRLKSKKFEFISKLIQRWQVKQPTRNWLELPSDLMLNTLQRISVIDRLKNAQRVCTAWHEICKDPVMWRVVHMERLSSPWHRFGWQEMCEQAVDRSRGQLVDLTIIGFSDNDFLQYVLDRSSQLKRLEIVKNVYDFYKSGVKL